MSCLYGLIFSSNRCEQLLRRKSTYRAVVPGMLFLFLFLNVPFSSSALCEILPSSLIKAAQEGAAAVLVEKKTQTLWVYTYNPATLQYDKVLEAACSTGEAAGRKKIEGDKKTPEGIYFIEAIFEDRYLTPVYGKRAFTTDYPNMLDTILGRTGSAIWIHGTDKVLKPMESNGCVAMNNNDVVKLDKYIVPYETPIVLADTIDYCSKEEIEGERIDVLGFLEQWRSALNKGTHQEFLAYYSKDYFPDTKWWMPWTRLRNNSSSNKKIGKGYNDSVFTKFANVGIYRQNDQFVVLFDLLLKSRDFPRTTVAVGKRKFFIESRNDIEPRNDLDVEVESNPDSILEDQLNYQIVGDRFQVVSIKIKKGKSPLIAAAEAFRKK